MSLCLPGLGQFYNEGGYRKVQGRRHISWWRAPIIWGGLGVTAYFSYYNWNQSSRIKDEWLYRQNNSGSFLYSEYLAYTDDELISGNGNTFYGFDQHAQWRDYSIAGFFVIYGLNVMDAFVDAHFVTFDVSQNLTVNLTPKYFPTKDYGLSLKFNIN